MFSGLNAREASEPVRMALTRRLLEVSIEALQLQQRWREGGATAGDPELSESINDTNVMKVGNKYSTVITEPPGGGAALIVQSKGRLGWEGTRVLAPAAAEEEPIRGVR